jgi:hypothetical protein
MFWWIGEGPRSAGRIEVAPDSVSLSATTPGAGVEQISFRDLARVLLERGLLHVERRTLPPVHIGSLDTPGALRELADVLSDAAHAQAI